MSGVTAAYCLVVAYEERGGSISWYPKTIGKTSRIRCTEDIASYVRDRGDRVNIPTLSISYGI